MEEWILNAPPGDGVSCLAFSPSSTSANDLLVASWDATVRLYDVQVNSNKFTCLLGGACLACCFNNDGSVGYAGGLDQGVYSLDMYRGGTKTLMGAHTAPVSCMATNTEHRVLFTGGWDGVVNAWDERAGGNGSNGGAQALDAQGGKVYSVSTQAHTLVAATSAKRLLLWDVRQLAQPVVVRESPLRTQLRAVALSPGGDFLALGSTEARIAVEHLGTVEQGAKKSYAFKCHRRDNVAYPVNALAFHPGVSGTFFSGGCDGVVNSWDGPNKKRVAQLPTYPTSISALSFSHDGGLLAIAASYTFEAGQEKAAAMRDSENIYVRRVSAAEVVLQS